MTAHDFSFRSAANSGSRAVIDRAYSYAEAFGRFSNPLSKFST